MLKGYPYFTIWEVRNVVIVHIYGARDIVLLFFYSDTLNMINAKWRIVYLGQYLTRKGQMLYDTTISILYSMGKKLW